MKKAKLFLTGIGLVAVVGATLAFNVKKADRFLYIGTAQNQCKKVTAVTLTTTTTAVGQLPVYSTLVTINGDNANNPCTQTTFTKTTSNDN